MSWYNPMSWGDTSSPPASSKPPPPPTTPNASATSPQQDCPLHSKHPCAVNKLMVTVTAADPKLATGTGMPPPQVLKLETTQVRRFEKVTDLGFMSSAATLLQTYDLLIDALGEPNVPQKHAAAAQIEAKAYYTSPDCETQSHSLLTRTDLHTHAVETLKSVGAPEIDLAPKNFYALSSWIDAVDARSEPFDNVDAVLSIVESLMQDFTCGPEQVDIAALACGTRAKGDGGGPNARLSCAVRVYRNSKWTLGVKLPPLFSKKRERESNLGVTGVTTTKKTDTTTAAGNLYRSSDSTTSGSDGSGKSTSERQFAGYAVTGESKTKADGTTTGTLQDNQGLSRKVNADGETEAGDDSTVTNQSGFEIVLSIDDQKVEMLAAAKKIKDEIKKINDVIQDIWKLFDKVPQVGWKFTVDGSVFTGSIYVQCKPAYVSAVQANGRYLAVEHQFSAQLDLQIFSLSIALSFGVDARALDSGLVLKIQGTISGKATLTTQVDLTFLNPKKTGQATTSSTASIDVIGYISLAGYTVTDAKLSVSSGLDFKGKFVADLSQGTFKVTGPLTTKEILVTGYIRGLIWNSSINPIQLLPPRVLHNFE